MGEKDDDYPPGEGEGRQQANTRGSSKSEKQRASEQPVGVPWIDRAMPVDDGLFIAAPRSDCLQIVVAEDLRA
ncbi:uncharacterized protein An16g05590 [Aspergillus niger]|uniref:Contig An16c0190, genomic contig n=2 Tax=Aspergillus niger TaxID=5061 RepID=A2R825_ASPNC|nr:uncharacterized protein An16g05590 [Aspergillus niger]CAK46899.1 unnamed protein product [Aspergillus niger]